MFHSLLIANRGEIACRIIRTARRLGLRTVAVYSEADADALHVQMADQAHLIGPAAATDSYLRVDRILDAAEASGAEAIHPGYGFLSERTDLAQACAERGLVWVGPHPEAIRSMGSKIESKAIAAAAGVPCIPGYSGADQSTETLVAEATRIGAPIMVKASAGGGGKGMRAVFDLADLPAAIDAARTEAKRSFGDDALLVEKLIQNPRHIEVQLLGDKHGNVVHLFERDCSVQRNHQKLLEEAPAPNLSDTTRDALFEAAIRLASKIGYDSTGTVEFVMDAKTEAFYFLEMNTRLQVEHTVTEEITGLDLVEQQLRVAAGEPLVIGQVDIHQSGHAIEARLTAEDVAKGFRPDTGSLHLWQPEPGLRLDSGVALGAEISAHYDSMLAKVVAHGPDRDAARKRLALGLGRMRIGGPKTNRLFLRDALMTPVFADGAATTEFVAREFPEGWRADAEVGWLAALACHIDAKPADTGPWGALNGFRLMQSIGIVAKATYALNNDPEDRVIIRTLEDGFEIQTQTDSFKVAATLEAQTLRVQREGRTQDIGAALVDGIAYLSGPQIEAAVPVCLVSDLSMGAKASETSPDRIDAQMQGLIVEIRVSPGDQVVEGQTVVVLESMKLLMELKAAADGTVSEVLVEPGQTVEAGRQLVRLALDAAG